MCSTKTEQYCTLVPNLLLCEIVFHRFPFVLHVGCFWICFCWLMCDTLLIPIILIFLWQHNTANDFTVLVEMRRCGITNRKSCLKSIVLGFNKGETVSIYINKDRIILIQRILQHFIIISSACLFITEEITIYAMLQMYSRAHVLRKPPEWEAATH